MSTSPTRPTPPVEEAGVEDELDAGVVRRPDDGWQAAEPDPDLEPEPPLTYGRLPR